MTIDGTILIHGQWSGGVLYVGAFAGRTIAGDPVAWQLLAAPGPFRLEGVPPGRWHVHAVLCPSWLPGIQRFPEPWGWGSYGGPYGYGRPIDPAQGGRLTVEVSRLWADLTYAPARQPLLTEPQWKAVHHVQRRLEALDSTDAALDHLCREVHLTRHYLTTLFKRATGFSPREYRTRLRVERARRLLIETELSVLDISLELGYGSPSHLHRLFSRYLDVTPVDLRRRARALQGGVAPAAGGPALNGLAPESVRLQGTVGYQGSRRGLAIYVGAFPRPVPDTYPVAWTALPRPGPFVLEVPPGEHYILACYCTERMRYPGDMATAFAGGGLGPLAVQTGVTPTPLALVLRDDDTAARFTGRWFDVFLPDGRQRSFQMIPEPAAEPMGAKTR